MIELATDCAIIMNMRLKVITYGQPVLRQAATQVKDIDDRLRKLIANMLETMAAENGVGLAAEQVGSTQAVCVVDVPADHDVDDDGRRLNPGLGMPLILINPEIEIMGKRRESQPEGCLSFPGITASVTRHYRIRARFMDQDGNRQEIEACDLVARAIQHEMDHLNGVLLVDRMSAVKKVSLSGTLKRLKAEQAV